jgi:hypothetical protein
MMKKKKGKPLNQQFKKKLDRISNKNRNITSCIYIGSIIIC